MPMDLDTRLRQHIYAAVTEHGKPPSIADLCDRTAEGAGHVRDSLARLASGRIVVLQPDSGEILMAPPFSAVPTPFVVETSRHASYANCAWDALGIPAALQQDAVVRSSCGQSDTPLRLRVGLDGPEPSSWLFHCQVPAARWWENLVFT